MVSNYKALCRIANILITNFEYWVIDVLQTEDQP